MGKPEDKRSGGHRRLGRCFGSTTLSAKGQVVIPGQARRELQLEQGTRLLVFESHGRAGTGLLLMSADTVADFVQEASSRLADLERAINGDGEEQAGS
jgi:AbrB family looped-hinge helix DNA binding protein